MKILLINSHFHLVGGAEKYLFELGKLLVTKGHKVAYFSTKSKDNYNTAWDNYFVSKIDFKDKSLINLAKIFSKVFYSLEAKRSLAKLLDNFKPEIVHLQNIYYYLTPSVLSEIKRRGIPIVQTVHDYQIITPSINFFHNSQICEITKRHKYYNALLHKCVDGSFGGSLIAVINSYLQKFIFNYENKISLFIAPSMFIKQKFIEYGIDASKIKYLPNFLNISEVNRKIARNSYVLFAGRFQEQKGIKVLLDTARVIPHIQFKIAGEGKEKAELQSIVRKNGIKNVKFLGNLNVKEMKRAIDRSAFCVVPSLWYENMPFSVLEAFALGKPVIGSRIGGIPELIKDGINGFLSEPGSSIELAKKISLLWENKENILKFGKNARKLVEDKYNSEIHYNKLISVYKNIIRRGK